jgi:hypothetical protein
LSQETVITKVESALDCYRDKTRPPQNLDESAVQEQLDNIISANPNFTKAYNPSSNAMKVTASVVLIAVALVL